MTFLMTVQSFKMECSLAFHNFYIVHTCISRYGSSKGLAVPSMGSIQWLLCITFMTSHSHLWRYCCIMTSHGPWLLRRCFKWGFGVHRKQPIYEFNWIVLSIEIQLITRQIWGIWKLRPAYSPETPNLGQNRWCFAPCDLKIWWMTLENNRVSLLCCFKLCASFHSHWWNHTGVTVRKAQFGSNSTIFRTVWPWNLTDDLEKQ